MDNIIPIEFDQLLAAVKQSIVHSGSIKDRIQKSKNTMFDKYYDATLELDGDVIVAKFKEPKKLSRIYKIANQKDLDKVINIFYVRYLLCRQFIDVDMHVLVKAYVERRRSHFGLCDDSMETIEGYIVSCGMYSITPLEDGNYELVTGYTDKAIIKPNQRMYELYHIPAVVDVVSLMVGFLINSALSPAQAENAEKAINMAIIAGHQFLVDEEYIDA